MDFRHTGTGRVISVIILFFFTWTFAGVYDVAYAVKNSDGLFEKNNRIHDAKEKSPAGKLEDALKGMRKALEDENLSYRDKKARVAALMDEVEALDDRLRAEFAATEKRLREKGLPGEIRKRHSEFVKHYESNMSALRKNATAIKESSRADFGSRAEAALKRLEKVKPPRRHVPLDPNKLPHRAAEPTKKEPRLKKEEFINDMRAQAEPILVASNGSLAGLLDENSQYMQLALAEGAPTQADLAETVEVKFTPAIQAKAQELGASPKGIYEWVRNNVEFVPTWGSIQGADMCLQTLQCNAFDTASLLIALLRASGIPARYAMGTVEMPMEKVMNWAGGFTDARAALDFMATGGIPIKGLVDGGKIVAAQMEHVWVEAWVDMIPSLGAIHKKGDTWVPLDASFKQYEYKRGLDIYEDMQINGEQYYLDYIADDTSIIPAELVDSFPDYVTSPYQYYNGRLFNVLGEKYPDWGIANIVGSRDLTEEDLNGDFSRLGEILGSASADEVKLLQTESYQILLGTLPYHLVVRASMSSYLPENLSSRINIQMTDVIFGETVLSTTLKVSELSAKKFILSFKAATAEDEQLVNEYGSIWKVPTYLVQVRPELKLEDTVIATGSAVGLGTAQKLNMTFQAPTLSADRVTNIVTAGDISAILIDGNRANVEMAGASMATLREGVGTIQLEGLLEQFLYGLGMQYFLSLNMEEFLYAKNFQMAISQEPAGGMVNYRLEPEYLFGMPIGVGEPGIVVDIDRNIYKPFPLDGNNERKRDFMIVSGLGSSYRENRTLEIFMGEPALSAATILRRAHKEGIEILRIDNKNMDRMISIMNISEDTITDIKNAVNAGMNVIVPKEQVLYGRWQGVGYIVYNPATGAAGYMIENGYAGSLLNRPVPVEELDDLFKRLCPELRDKIARYAISLVKTLYTLGCKGQGSYLYEDGKPIRKCGNEIDCSGLTYRVFEAVGIESLGSKVMSAQSQFDATADNKTDYPLIGDLFFYRATWDKNGDGKVDVNDKITHVGLTLTRGYIIHASSRIGGVSLDRFSEASISSPKFAGFQYPPEYNNCNSLGK